MAGNRFGQIFTFVSWGESHGPAIGCVIDGVPPRLNLSPEIIQRQLDRRRPGNSPFVSQRKETDQVDILSGVFEGRTTGTPISLLIRNLDHRSEDYTKTKNLFRPGHADFAYQQKYGIYDHRGGGRASARETAARVAAGAIAREILSTSWGKDFSIQAAVTRIGPEEIDRQKWDWNVATQNPFFCPDPTAIKRWKQFLDSVLEKGDSVGALIELHVKGMKAGLGEPVYDKLDAELAKALMSINAVKGIEIGAGFESAMHYGSEQVDAMIPGSDQSIQFTHNHAGGILGGISTGQDLILRIAVKPTSSIQIPVHTVDQDNQVTLLSRTGRHDPCVGIRAVPVAEAMVACVLADHWLRYKAQCL